MKSRNIWHLLYMLALATSMIILAKANLKMELFKHESLELTNTDAVILILLLLYQIIYATVLWVPLVLQELFETFFDVNLKEYFKNKKAKREEIKEKKRRWSELYEQGILVCPDW